MLLRVHPRAAHREALLALAALAATILSGCTSSARLSQEELAQLDSAPLCCKTSRDIPIPGLLQTQLRASVTASSPVFLFPAGRSRAYGFELPDRLPPYEIELRALPMRRISSTPTGNLARVYFYPALMFLDDHRDVITDESSNQPVAECIGFGCEYSLRFEVPVPSGARYAVLHTVYPKIGADYSTTPQAPRADSPLADKALVYPGRPQQVFAQFGALGDVVVSVRAPVPSPPPAVDRPR